ncbi:OmpA family protein [Paraglaciecola aquimarina]|uniref:OmpA family protein n=1 Tax=Paraglaciecola algarum TaxID=3050085 RepID=A0ABS9D8I4_9ALTE|nr:OmpA family protein [Paraglaciecola sp. G1-23]MCF2949024.1 OmpA family protein [Paraglaciecola sp. G1-23]
MTSSKQSQTQTSDSQQMEKIRQLVLGEDASLVKQTLKDNAREMVAEVFSEALHDREKNDGSVNKVLLPLVEKSVEKSVSNHSEQFVGYLYPLVGSLVRKSVTAFITDLLEKTNALIENSLTVKGLKWRFRAWRSNVPFSQYVASQTFSFRVEQVFLIHKETGLLLNSVSLNLGTAADADMVSSMLTAINDFVADSFKPNADSSEQQLDVVRTDDFTLVIKPGPKAAVVAAVTGNMPQHVADQLQVTLEDIHKLYDKELNNFNGDALTFENSENQLRDCLIAELKPEAEQTSKTPWMAWSVVFLLLCTITFLMAIRWQSVALKDQIELIDRQPGILITSLELNGLREINLNVLRDPSAIIIKDWLGSQNISLTHLNIKERAYLSLDPELIKHKVQIALGTFPNIQIQWQGMTPSFSGLLTNFDKLMLQNKLSGISGLNFIPSWLDGIVVNTDKTNAADDPNVIRAILDLNIAKIEKMSVAFEKGKSELSVTAIEKLISIKDQFNNLINLAEQQQISLGLVIMGATDTVGTPKFNQILSQKRADNVKLKLQELGISNNRLNAIGLGVIDLKTTNAGARKVLFNVVYFDAS